VKEINWPTLIGGLVAAGKLVSNSFGINIPDELINDLVNGVAAIMAIVAIFMSHKKKEAEKPNEPTKYTIDNSTHI
jgi:uncharacterized membrane protein